jgi:2-polyprenyl-3-methyl-5-hydroxy-6-metoxy-1,4-benzoquinol methylase
MSPLADLYENKPAYYFSFPREDLVEAVRGNDLRVLEVGCGAGATGRRLLQTGKARWVTGIELMEVQAEMARQVLNEVLVGDISQLALPWPPASFDCIIAGDVLEHLADPWNILKILQPLLAANGTLITTIPNVRYWPVVLDLVFRGEWLYRVEGVLDQTHLRFFTRRSAVRLLEDSGYRVASVQACFSRRRIKYLNTMTGGLAVEFLAERWMVAGHPAV